MFLSVFMFILSMFFIGCYAFMKECRATEAWIAFWGSLIMSLIAYIGGM